MSGYIRQKPQKRPAHLSANDFYFLRRQRRQTRIAAGLSVIPSVEELADPENLLRVFHRLKREAGQSPGADGLTYSMLGNSEIARCMRGLSLTLRSGRYRPGPSRKVQIPKFGGTGFRTLSLRDLVDRVVAAALHDALTPFWDGIFLPRSMGFRPGRGVWDMLLAMERTILEKDLHVVTTDDIRNAFDNVNITDVINDHRRCMDDPRLINLIEVVLRGDSQNNVGIEQGNAYSPTALNVRLHFVHDLGLGQGSSSPSFYRYADNLVYLSRDVPEGLQTLQQSHAQLLSAGFILKGEDGPPVHLLRGEKAQTLGFLLSWEGRIRLELGETAWKGLERDLEGAHEAINPPILAAQAVRGWLVAYGPAFESTRRDVLERVLRMAASYGFREFGTFRELWKVWLSSWERWNKRRKANGTGS